MSVSSRQNPCPISRATCVLSAILAPLLLAASAVAAGPEVEVDYLTQVRPILARNCFACHGQDEEQRAKELRIDRREFATKELEDGTQAIVPGDPDASEMVARIIEEDVSLRMPPKKSGVPLSAEEVDLIKRWIAQGAPYAEHWAFVPPAERPLPSVRSRDGVWPRNGIDSWILDRLVREGLEPSPEADRFTLLRRVSLDLRGLPPTPREIETFAADSSPDAYEKAVERFLADPGYGERWARMWLDLARYADSAGYGSDPLRPNIWRYRDWVIDAFNRNMPYDRFTVEQIAGDLLPNPTLEQRIATGFQRNTMVNFEGGADPDEYLTKYVVDRVNTTAAIYLGTTLACAECHDHKYDPFTQRDFYRFYAFFNTIDEKGLDGKSESPAPRLKVPTAEQEAGQEEIRGQITRLDDLLKGPLPTVDAAQARWERDQAEIRKEPTLGWKVLEPSDLVSRNDAMLTKLDDQSVLAGGADPDVDVFEVTAQTSAKAITALRLEALTHESLAHKGAARGENGNFVLTGFEVEAVPANGAEPARKVVFSRAEADYSQDEKGYHVSKAIDADPSSGWAVSGDKHRVDRRAIFVAEAPFGFESGTTLKIRLKFESGLAQHVLGRFRLALTTSKAPSLNLVPSPKIAALLETPEASRTEAQAKEVREYYRGTLSAEIQPFRGELAALRKAEEAIDRAIPTTMVMKEQETPRATHILMRGDFRSKGEAVTPDVPRSLPRIPDGQPANRLGLARWLVEPGHPLVARVTVNRFWQHYFGVGLVKTSNDFGTQGEWPSHPELLDWLATEFIASGWDVKALQKQIVLSATYRQGSRLDPVEHERDPENRLLARGPRFRLDAETIRDNALAISGLLNPRMGGSSIFPYQPPGLWEELAFGGDFTSQSYTTSKGNDLYRRGLYTYWKRSLPSPSLTVFDAPNRELCTVQRPRTNTPLQALVLLNDPVYVETARVLAQRTIQEGGSTPPDRLAYAFRLCTARAPSDRELDVLLRHYHQQLDNYRKDPKAAAALIRVGDSPRPAGLDDAELAAWTAIGNILLNLDETITKG